MKKILAVALVLGGCAHHEAPDDIFYINHKVNSTRVYEYYHKKDWRYLNAGQAGNCAAFSFTKYVELVKIGKQPKINVCRLKDGDGHAYVMVDGWALDNRFKTPVRENEIGCK